MLKVRLKVKWYSFPEPVIFELWAVTCHMKQVNTARLNRSQTGHTQFT